MMFKNFAAFGSLGAVELNFPDSWGSWGGGIVRQWVDVFCQQYIIEMSIVVCDWQCAKE